MSTMKGEFVEKATMRFFASVVAPVVDQDIANGKATDLGPLLKPIGFNTVLQSSYGTELESLDGGLWAEWKRVAEKAGKIKMTQLLITLLLGLGPFSLSIQRMLTGSDLIALSQEQRDVVRKFGSAKAVDAAKDENVRLFSDFVEDYVKMDNGKYTRTQLQNDMMTMIIAAVDTLYGALSCALLEAARHPELQKVLHDEVVKAFGDDIESIKLKGGITKIPKLRAFIQLSCPHCFHSLSLPSMYIVHFQRGFEDSSSCIVLGNAEDCG